MTLQKRSYTAGHFELQIDGHTSTAYIKSVEGGHAKSTPVTEPIGPMAGRIKHSGPMEIDPISLELGLAGSQDILKWVQDSWNRKFTRRNGQITHADFDLKPTYEHQFTNALITETTFPTLDGASKEPGYLKIKLQPESVATSKTDGSAKIGGPMGSKQKLWLTSAFRFNIDGIDEMAYCNKLDSFTIKQSIKPINVGKTRWPQFEPTKLEYPTISGTMSLQYADKLMAWHKAVVLEGKVDPSHQKHGSIEFLSPDRKTTIFTIEMFYMGISSLSMVPSTANSDQIKRVKFELYMENMQMDSGSGLGLG